MNAIASIAKRMTDRNLLLPSFTYHVRRGVLVIIDTGLGPAVEKHADAVLQDIYIANPGLAALKIIYRDAQGIYNGMQLIDNRWVGLVELNVPVENDAIDRLGEWS